MFNFGTNWLDYSVRVLDQQHVDEAMLALAELLGSDVFRGKRFVDIGFGSGIASIGAGMLGVDSVVGIDISDESLAAATINATRFVDGTCVPEFRQGSVLDSAVVESLGSADIVYAWGVLHHTGRMWDAMRNAVRIVAPGGTFVVAIYNKHFTSPVWKCVKWVYNKSPRLVQRAMYYGFIPLIISAKFVATRKNPVRKRRGMDFYIDVVDWLGGYPYEYAKPDHVESFVTALGFELVKKKAAETPIGCNEFVFRKIDAGAASE